MQKAGDCMNDSIYFQNFDDFLRKLKELEADCEQAAKNVLNRRWKAWAKQ